MIVVLLVAATWNKYQNQSAGDLSVLLLDNVEALASGEGAGPDWQGFKTVYGPSRTCCQRDAPTAVCSGSHGAC